MLYSDEIKWACVNWGSLMDDGETAPLGDGPVGPIPSYDNPNS